MLREDRRPCYRRGRKGHHTKALNSTSSQNERKYCRTERVMDIALVNRRYRLYTEKGPNKIFLLTPPKHEQFADFEQGNQHLTTAGTAKLLDHYKEVLEIIPKQVGDKVRSNLIFGNGQATTAQRRHERVTTAYQFGCKKCWEIGHGQLDVHMWNT